jgi:hypothetical protein
MIMNLPEVINKLLQAQADFDSRAYADCFAETAIVYDEDEMHEGKERIRQWNETTNAKYRTVLEPVDFSQDGSKAVLTAKVSGTFDGSPVLLDYHLEIIDDQITSLEITIHQ